MEAQMKRGFLEACVLAAVSGEESYGYQIVKDVPASMGLTESTLYPLLKRLEKAGCITARSAEHNGRLRRYYRITDDGRARIEEFLGRLGELLACLPAEQVEETKAFYAEAIADRMEDGMSEEEAVAAMGTPGEVAEATLDDLPAVPRAIARTRRRSTALLWVLTIVGSPVWVPLLAAFAAVAVTVYICIWVLALCVWIVAAALGGVGVVELLLAVSGVTIGHFPYALASAGVGLGLVGVALFVGAGAWAASKQIARLSALWARKAASPFWKGKGEKGGAAAHLAA